MGGVPLQSRYTAIIDRTSGKIVWRLGPTYPFDPMSRRLPRPVDQISGEHDVHMIADGLPGAGDLLLFDNQGGAGYPTAPLNPLGGSRVLEIDPVRRQIVWQYRGDMSGAPMWTFHSWFISSARRLPNGDTLIDEGANGRFFQITPTGEIVWEYVSPYFGHSTAMGSLPGRSNWVYRAQPVPYDWTPKGTPPSEIAVTPPDLATFHVVNAGSAAP